MSARILVFDSAAGSPVGGTTAEDRVCRAILTRDELESGALIEFEALVRATATVGADTLTVRVRFGTSSTSSLNTAVATGSTTDVATDDRVLVRGRVHIQTDVRGVLTIVMDNPPAGHDGTATPRTWSSIYVLTAATTHYLDVTVEWSTISANSAQSEAWAVWRIE